MKQHQPLAFERSADDPVVGAEHVDDLSVDVSVLVCHDIPLSPCV
jgi:hypothetical protein